MEIFGKTAVFPGGYGLTCGGALPVRAGRAWGEDRGWGPDL